MRWVQRWKVLFGILVLCGAGCGGGDLKGQNALGQVHPRLDGQISVQLIGPASLTVECGGSNWPYLGAMATDGQGNPLPITETWDPRRPDPYTLGSFTGTYAAGDASAPVSAQRTVTVADSQPPTLALRGASTIELQCGSPFWDLGASAVDSCTGDLSARVVVTGSVDIMKAANYSLYYHVSDSAGHTAPTVERKVTVVNCPVINDDTFPVPEESGPTVLPLLANDFPAPGAARPLIVVGVTWPSVGELTWVGSEVLFTPPPDYVGPASFTYTVSDGAGFITTANVTVDVTPVNDPPTAEDDIWVMDEDSGTAEVDVLANDSSAPDADEMLTVESVEPSPYGTLEKAGSKVRFTPAPDFSGIAFFTYTVSDGNGGTATATVLVVVNPTNDPPTAADDTLVVASGSGVTFVNVLANDTTGPDVGEVLTVVGASESLGGEVTYTDTLVSFTPSPCFSGPTSFTYTVSDGNGLTATATVNVIITAVSNGGPQVRAVDVGTYYTVALTADGTVRSWGSNNFGQLGDGTIFQRNSPVPVPGLSDVTAIAADECRSVALTADGTVWAWGKNGVGQLGDGTTFQRNSPVPVPGLSDVAALAAGSFHTMALKADGTVWAWGNNGFGQLGDGTAFQRTSPAPVQGLSDVTALAAGYYHTVALKADGTVQTWGYNSFGQLGDGTTFLRWSPVQVPGLSDITAIAAGGHHTVALKADGTVWVWGQNDSGQLGDGTTITQRKSPVPVPGISNVTAIAAGSDHTVALTADGTVWAWGNNGSGQLGDETTAQRNEPGQVHGLSGATAIAASAFHTVSVRGEGTVCAWGANNTGQLGDGTTTRRLKPVLVQSLP